MFFRGGPLGPLRWGGAHGPLWGYRDFYEIHLYGMVFFGTINRDVGTKDPGNERIRIVSFQRMSKH